ncbi:DUF2911 domain-containing protein [Gracilimonas sp.]|uniref:DUF2911 domain-containing protein n=1 Tax=Gracilimonas sp. TaxID=1974203 RepID=UPI0025C0C2FF|nr:DUF2911 domain-containing protein [Gracilimonas sp.]
MINQHTIRFSHFIVTLLFLGVFFGCQNQGSENPRPSQESRKSPIAIASVKGDGSYVKVVYGQPYRRGRTIFGDLQPWGEVWRTGANEATEITITDPVLMGDQAINSGTYTLFTIPGPDSFTVILNHELGQWGAFEYNPERDYKRMKFPVQKLSTPVEAFTIEFSEPEYSMSTMSLKWDRVRVDIPIRFYGE